MKIAVRRFFHEIYYNGDVQRYLQVRRSNIPAIEALALQHSMSACAYKRTHDGRKNCLECCQGFQRIGTLAPTASGCDWLTAKFP